MENLLNTAKNEWESYLIKAGAKKVDLEFKVDETSFNQEKFNLNNVVFDSRFDDAFSVDISYGKGLVTATNERSVLLAVYEILRRIGFVFFSPTKQGEYIPNLRDKTITLSFTHYANCRYRGIDICAPREINSIKDYIRWLPKIGLNSLFLEGYSGNLSYRSWYLHEENEFLPKENYDIADAFLYDKECVDLAKSLGLIYHAMGHGWNVATFSNDRFNDMFPTKDTVIDYNKIAIVDGKRELPNGILRCANLCLSNKEVQFKLVDLVISYIKENPQVDVLHFWLGDSVNKVCECEDCVKTTISDQYVKLLNKIDFELTKIGSMVKIVFLLYHDTLFIPIEEKITSNRFIMMLAPITRDYSKPILAENIGKKQEYVRNKMLSPIKPEDFVAHLKEWQCVFTGDSFAFDYQNYYASRYDLSGEYVSRLIVNDIKEYKKLGLNGLISCQFYRNEFPHAFSTYAMARTLFDSEFDFKSEKGIYYKAVFGFNYKVVENYLMEVKDALPLKYYQWFGETERIREESELLNLDFEKIVALKNKTKQFEKKLSKRLENNTAKILYYYTKTILAIINIIEIKNSNGDIQEQLLEREKLRIELSKNEEFLLPYCSIDHVLQTMYWLVVN